ncbi:OmpP1/FadL family transporter [Hymenobacter rubripertinctus]|uniref:Aromatic hydrocarbon degradation protein n=1 Tax=Hymenobacter rubripertinctus TaxID=2029981 RepID=A0A418R2D4_9BACT|nr:hypothetical protein [Hymenobacter rubripertinctus]RIY11548.1 hypothetical protein D0T11_06995 [Hymenobacter rubripertinctus]
MKLLKYGFAVALMGSASHAFAQYQTDALRYSQTQPAGTARTLGIGGASTAVGGDFGSVAVNPAGLGMYQRSEFTFSPGFTNLSSNSRGFGNTTADSRSNLHVANLGLVFTTRRPDDDANPWRAGSFAIGITRTADFNQSFRYQGKPDLEQDIFQRFSENQGGALDELAYNTYLTDKDAQGTYIPIDFDNTGQLNQGETVRRTGANTQFDLAYGTSYQDKLYIGGGVGIISSRYNSENVLTASDPQPVTPVSQDDGTSFASLTLRDNLLTKGSGINARIGLIYKPVNEVRIGASVQTPTYFQLEEVYSSSLDARFDKPVPVDGKSYMSKSFAIDDEPLSYTLTTPFRATAGVAVVLGKSGFLSGDVEYVDYSSAQLANNTNGNVRSNRDFGPDNDAVRSLYTNALNLRAGIEGRLDIFRVRAGYAHYGSPYQSSATNQSRNYYTGGVGLRQNNFFLDASGVYSKGNLLYTPYSLANDQTPVIQIDTNRFTTTLTAGFIF